MREIEFQNTQYKLREVDLPEMGSVLISTEILNKVLITDSGSHVSDEAIAVDEMIYCFVNEKEIELSNEELTTLITSIIK